MRKEEPKIYLFIIWEKSRNKTEQILDDLREKFVIRDVYEVKWSKGNFLNNLKRFYGQSLPDAQQKAEECGTGPFLLIIVSDPHPEFVEPSKSGFAPKKDLVNTNIGDSKEEYRKWVGKEFTVHSSVSENETNHNSTLLFGKNTQDFEKDLPEKWTGSIKNLESDLIGHDGWKDMKQLLYVMNGTLNYVILRNFEGMPAEFDYHDVDILVNDEKLPYIADKDFSPFRDDPRTIELKVGEKTIMFNPKYFGDHYYDERWEKDILKRRTFHPNGFYTPCKEDYFYTLLYHVTFHGRWKKIGKISDKYKKILSGLAKELDMNEVTNRTFDDIDYSKKMVEEYMSRMSYRDPSTLSYKLTHGEFLRLVKVSIFIAKTQGIQFLLIAIKGKIRVMIKTKMRK
jgi:hypothetical protein